MFYRKIKRCKCFYIFTFHNKLLSLSVVFFETVVKGFIGYISDDMDNVDYRSLSGDCSYKRGRISALKTPHTRAPVFISPLVGVNQRSMRVWHAAGFQPRCFLSESQIRMVYTRTQVYKYTRIHVGFRFALPISVNLRDIIYILDGVQPQRGERCIIYGCTPVTHRCQLKALYAQNT